MSRIHYKFLIAGIILAGSVAYLVLAGVNSGWVYYMQVDDYVAQSKYHPQRVRLLGHVAQEGIEVQSSALTARFVLTGASQQLPVQYKGVIPDTFKSDIEVVVEGKMDEAGTFQATLLLTKCASKYNEKMPDGRQPTNHPSVEQEVAP